jgi:hypothetical protein
MEKNPAAVQKFLEVTFAACREMTAGGAAWKDDVLNTATTWTGISVDTLRRLGGVTYCDPNGTVSIESLNRVQQVWIDAAQVKQKVDVAQLVDQRAIDAALGSIGKSA